MENFKKVLKEVFEEAIENEKERLLDKNEEDYFQGYDKDFVDVGVGYVCVRQDAIYNEEALEDDAKENVIDKLIELDVEFENICMNEKFLKALAELLKGM